MDEMSASAGAARLDPMAGSGGDNGTSAELPDSFLTLKNLRRIAVASKLCLQGADEFLCVSGHDPASYQDAAEEDQEPDTGWASMNEISASIEAPKMPLAAYLKDKTQFDRLATAGKVHCTDSLQWHNGF